YGTIGVTASFGGQGVRVKEGQTITLEWEMENAKFIDIDKKETINLFDKSGIVIADVKFYNSEAVITFNNYAEGLKNVEGALEFYHEVSYDNVSNDDEPGSVKIKSGDIYEKISIIKPEENIVGTETDNMYRKQGVALGSNYPNRIDWVFMVNAAKKDIDNNVSVLIEDILEETMIWEEKILNENNYVLAVSEKSGDLKWLSRQEAENIGIKITIENEKLTIDIPEGKNLLKEKSLEFRIPVIVTKEALANPSIKHVKNESNITVNNDIWKVEEDEKKDQVHLNKSGGWITGTVQGQLVINKVIEGTKIGIPNVEFEVEEINGEYKQVIKTDENGKAEIKDLEVGKYKVKELSAPDWIDFDASVENKTLSFDISNDDEEGIDLEISNKKKLIDLKVEKVWIDNNIENLEANIALLRDGDIIESIKLVGNNKVHIWEDLEISDDYGNFYNYTVKELGEEDGYIVIDNNRYKVAYDKNDDGFIILNELIEIIEETPEKPEEKDPSNPGEETPEKPGEKDPSNPGEETPEKPGEKDPSNPGEERPEKPEEKDPSNPGEETPEKPEEKNPSNPDKERPGKPEELEDNYISLTEKPGNPDNDKTSKPEIEEGSDNPKDEVGVIEDLEKDKADGSQTNNGNKKDNDKDQDIKNVEVKKPELGGFNNIGNKGKELPKTGDGLNSIQLGVLTFIFGVSLILTGFKLNKDEE
ncbi:MAG TPA: SpaA isopeptide-forming pilin-related protein, partial [Tissierellaceae bacterium]